MLGSKTSESIATRGLHEVRPDKSVLPVLLDSSGSLQSSRAPTEEALQSILPMKLTEHTPIEVGATEKLLPSPRESVVSGNVQSLVRTPVVSVNLVRDVIPEDLLSTVSPPKILSDHNTYQLPEVDMATSSSDGVTMRDQLTSINAGVKNESITSTEVQ